MKHVFIINPQAGKAHGAEKLIPDIKKYKSENPECSIEYYITQCAGDAKKFTRDYALAQSETVRFYACGGDGTLGELVNGTFGIQNAQIGCIPVGTGNDFVRNFTNGDNFMSIEKQITGTPVTSDLIKYNDSYCINMINIGFDCNVVAEAARQKNKKYLNGVMAYIFGVVIVLAKEYGIELSINVNGESSKKEQMLLFAFANGGYCGGGFHSSLSARINDGIIDAYLVHKIGRMKFLGLLPNYRTGTYINTKRGKKCVEHLRGTNYTVESENAFNICADGEITSVKKVDISIIKSAAQFIVPNGSLLAE